MNRLIYIFICTTLYFPLLSQVTLIGGSYATASASGSGASGVPTLNYAVSAGADRLLIFTMAFERDHASSNGDNWADPAATGGSKPSVTLNSINLTHIVTTRYYQYATTEIRTDATMSLELMVFGILEANIPAGTHNFVISGLNQPDNAGDEAILSAMMFENVNGVNNLTSSGCQNCNSIAISSQSPNDANNMILGLSTTGSNRTYSAGTGYTLINSTNISNTNGSYTDFSEQDGMTIGSQYITGTTDNQTIPFGISGSADVFGAVNIGLRLVTNNPLPVELLSFSGFIEKNKHYLFWETAMEINNDRFEIEHSENGIIWNKIGEVKGNGMSFDPIKYNFTVLNPKYNICYYRFKQVDYNTEFEYSPIITLISEKNESLTKIYPNPTSNEVYINSEEKISEIYIINLSGQIIYSENDILSYSHKVSLLNLPISTYFISIHQKGSWITKKVIKR